MNDPNGLVVVDGRWHAFHQSHPQSDQWGPMHWGHASTVDLVHWDHHPIALAPDELGTIFSGSVVRDTHNDAGFGAGSLVAFFTHHADSVQHQSVAYSTDGGITWTKFAGNPVLPGTSADFRDPKVRHDGDRWTMVVTLADRVAFYESVDLLHWTATGEFTTDLAEQLGVGRVGAWECPDLVDAPGVDGRTHTMLVVSLAEGGPDGHSATVALPGRFARGSFEQLAPAVRLDHGPDFYAMQTFFDAPHGSAVGMGWMNSWRYANQVPSRGRRGVLSLPRQFAFDDVGELCSWPVSLPHHRVEDGAQWLTTTDDVVVEISGVDGVAAVAGVLDGVAFIERFADLVEGYAARYELELAVHGQHLVVVDHGTVEVFAAGGHVAMSAQVFAGPDWTVRIA